MRLAIEGYACIGSFGQTPQELYQQVCTHTPLSLLPPTDTTALKDLFAPRALRQMDHFTKMALLSAYTCLASTKADMMPNMMPNMMPGMMPNMMHEGYGIILASGYGTASPTFSFLDSVVKYGEEMASPLAFSHSVHNIPVATIAEKCSFQGPCSTLCQLHSPVSSGLLFALNWLLEGRVQRVLFGAVDEVTPTLTATAQQCAGASSAEALKKPVRLGEGAAFFSLSLQEANARFGSLRLDLSSTPEACANDRACFYSGKKNTSPPLKKAVPLQATYGALPVAQALDIATALVAVADVASPYGTEIACVHTPFQGSCSTVLVSSAATPW